MTRKRGSREPAPQPDDEDLQALEQRLTVARQDPATRALAQILEWRLACARGEPKRLVLNVTFMGPLRLLSARLVGGNDAEDVAHDAFVSLLSWMQATPVPEIEALLDSEDGVARLLYQLTVWRAYDHHRRKKRRREDPIAQDDRGSAGELTQVVQPPFLAPDIKRVEQAYAALTPVQRIAHVLHHYYGFTDADFENTLGWKRATSRSLVHRANQALRRAMSMDP